MERVLDQPISLDTVVGFLVETPLFDGLEPDERAEVVRIMEIQRLQEGEWIFHEGEVGDAWYVIFEGQAEVVKRGASGPAPIATLEPGDCFGEMALLDGLPRSASVQAAGPLTLFRFRRVRFEELLEQGSLGAYKLVAAMARTLSRRHRQLTHQLSELRGDEGSGDDGRAEIGTVVDSYRISE